VPGSGGSTRGAIRECGPRVAMSSEADRWEGDFARARIPLLVLALTRSFTRVTPLDRPAEYYSSLVRGLVASAWERTPLPVERFLREELWVRYDGQNFLLTPRALFGYYLHAFEPATARYLLSQRGGVFLDVGANAGQYAVPLARNFREVVAVEPNPVALGILAKNVERNGLRNVRIWPKAVAPQPGRVRLYEGAVLTTWGLRDVAARYVDVDAILLDELLHAHDRVDLLKLDIEGVEADVLLGSQELDRVRAICFAGFPRDLPRLREHLSRFGLEVRFLAPIWGSAENFVAERRR
jgi:FkbM family methyltransferase